MCGIVGIISSKEVSNRIINSLKKLEYRGYDSAGIATITENNINEVKCEGRVNELEKNVNLVKFEKNRIEISFNESLDKDFVKDLSSKLFEWTGERWIITFSKLKGQMSVKDKEKNVKKQLMDEIKNSEIFKSVKDKFPDAELIDVNSNKDGVDND